jgi:ribosomal protein L37E
MTQHILILMVIVVDNKMTIDETIAKIDECKYLQTCLSKHIISMIQELKNTCDRSCGFVERKNKYNFGNYNDVAYTIKWDECSKCGFRDVINLTEHNWY